MQSTERIDPPVTAGTPDLADRDLRQRELVPPAALARCHALVIGVGAIGRQVALQLAAVGAAHRTLVDFDTGAVDNLAAQGYGPADLGEAKVLATARLCRSINPQIRVIERFEPFAR